MELEPMARPMTADQERSFAQAATLNEQAGVLLMYGLTFEAALVLEEASCYAVSKSAKQALLERAMVLLLNLRAARYRIIH